MSSLAIAGLVASVPLLYTLLKRNEPQEPWDPAKYDGRPIHTQQAPVQLNQTPPGNALPPPPPTTPKKSTKQENTQQQTNQIINQFHMLDVGRYTTNLTPNKTYKTGVLIENKNEYLSLDMTPDERYKNNHKLNDIVFNVTGSTPQLSFASSEDGVTLSADHLIAGNIGSTSFTFNGQRARLGKIENALVDGAYTTISSRSSSIQLEKTLNKTTHEWDVSLRIPTGTYFEHSFQLVKGSRIVLKPLENKNDSTFSDRFAPGLSSMGTCMVPPTGESSKSPFYQQIQNIKVDNNGMHTTDTHTDNWRRKTLVDGRKRALDDIRSKHSRMYQKNTDGIAAMNDKMNVHPVLLNSLKKGKAKIWNTDTEQWDDPSPTLKVEGIGRDAKIVFWDEEKKEWSETIKNYNPETKVWETYDPKSWKPSMERADITSKQASRLHRGFATKPNGRSYVEPMRETIDRHKAINNPYDFNVTKTTRLSTSIPVYGNNTLHRYGTDPKYNATYEKKKTLARRPHVPHHENYVYNRGYGSRVNLRKEEHPEYDVRQSRKWNNTDTNNSEISAQNDYGMVMRANTRQVDTSDNVYEDERVNSSTELVHRGRLSNKKHSDVNLVQQHNVKVRSTRKPLRAWHGKSPSSNKTVYLHEEGAARTTRPANYVQTRGGIGSKVDKSKAVIRLNRINTIPGMMVGRGITSTLVEGDMQERNVQIRTNRQRDENHNQTISSRLDEKKVNRDYADKLHMRGRDPTNIGDDATDRDRAQREPIRNQETQSVNQGIHHNIQDTHNKSDRREVRTAYIPMGPDGVTSKTARKSRKLLLQSDPTMFNSTKIEKKRSNQYRDVPGYGTVMASSVHHSSPFDKIQIRGRNDADLHLDTARHGMEMKGEFPTRLQNVDPEKHATDTAHLAATVPRPELSSEMASKDLRPDTIQRTVKTNDTTVIDGKNNTSGRHDGTHERFKEAMVDGRNAESVRSLTNTFSTDGPAHYHVPRDAERQDLDTLNENVQQIKRNITLGTGNHTGIANQQTEYTTPVLGQDHIKIAAGIEEDTSRTTLNTYIQPFERHDNSERLPMMETNFSRNDS